MPFIPAYGRQRKEDLHDLEACLVYKKSRTWRTVTQRNTVLGTNSEMDCLVT